MDASNRDFRDPTTSDALQSALKSFYALLIPDKHFIYKRNILSRRKDLPELSPCRCEDIENTVLGTINDLDVFHVPTGIRPKRVTP